MTLCKRLSHALPALLLTTLVAASSGAQAGVALGVRSGSGNEAIAANSDRRGLELRAFWDGDFNPVLGWRAELAGTQMQFQRDDSTQRFPVSENGFELAAAARARLRSGSLSGLYALAGPIFSVRVLCGTSGQFSSNGRVVCDEGETQSLGYQLGLGFASRAAATRDLLFEARYLDGVVSGAGNPLIALSIGIRWRR